MAFVQNDTASQYLVDYFSLYCIELQFQCRESRTGSSLPD